MVSEITFVKLVYIYLTAKEKIERLRKTEKQTDKQRERSRQ